MAAQHREEREARRHQKDIERRLKEQTKLSALEKARLEVEAYENSVEVLLSVHRDQSAPVDWEGLAWALPPHEPFRIGRHEWAASFRVAKAGLDAARSADDVEYRQMSSDHEQETAEIERLRSLAKRVLMGQSGAYTEAVSECSPLGEIANLGSYLNLTVHDAKLVECVLNVNGKDVIPREVKSLTAAGKLSVKAMPKQQFHQLYQDYVCGCVLRVMREMFALLPVGMVLVTATVDATDPEVGGTAEIPVVSVATDRSTIMRLDFDRLSPSDALRNLFHRGEVEASRKLGEFVRILPLTATVLSSARPDKIGVDDVVQRIRQLRAEMESKLDV